MLESFAVTLKPESEVKVRSRDKNGRRDDVVKDEQGEQLLSLLSMNFPHLPVLPHYFAMRFHIGSSVNAG